MTSLDSYVFSCIFEHQMRSCSVVGNAYCKTYDATVVLTFSV